MHGLYCITIKHRSCILGIGVIRYGPIIRRIRRAANTWGKGCRCAYSDSDDRDTIMLQDFAFHFRMLREKCTK